MEVASELILIGLIVKVPCHCLYIVNGSCIGVDTDWIDCEVLWQCLYIVNGGCIGVNTGRIDCESVVPMLVCN